MTERLSYDAWGKRRNANGTDAVCGTITSAATRGFTGHEMLGGLCLVNMNARIYDPDLGRFMAADTHVTDPLNLQDWNAYTYVNNNPLSFTDPTGHELTVGSATVVISQDAQSRAWVADANPNCSGCGPTTSEIKDAIKGAIGIYSGMSVSPSGLKVTTVGGIVNVHLAAGKWMNTGGNNTAHPVQNSGGAQAASNIDASHRSGSQKYADNSQISTRWSGGYATDASVDSTPKVEKYLGGSRVYKEQMLTVYIDPQKDGISTIEVDAYSEGDSLSWGKIIPFVGPRIPKATSNGINITIDRIEYDSSHTRVVDDIVRLDRIGEHVKRYYEIKGYREYSIQVRGMTFAPASVNVNGLNYIPPELIYDKPKR